MKKVSHLKILGILAASAGIIGIFLILPRTGGILAQTPGAFPGHHEVSLSGPSSVSMGRSGEYTGTITWRGSVPPSLLGTNKYLYEFIAESPSGARQTSGRVDTFTSSSPRSFRHTFTFNEAGRWDVCFTAWLVFNGGSEQQQKCIALTVSGGTAPPPAPAEVTAHIDAHPNPIFRGESSTLTWTSANATRCVASGGWSGTKALNGSQTVSPQVTTTFTITCSNVHDTASDAVTVVVRERAPPSPPPQQEICGDGIDNDGDGRVDEDCPVPPQEVCGDGIDNDGDGRVDENCPAPAPVVLPAVDIDASPRTIDRGETSLLFWNSQNTTRCTASGGWSGTKTLNGSETVSPSENTTFIITCINQHGSAQDAVTVFVRTREPPQVPLPRVTLDANPRTIDRGETSTLTWASRNAERCFASGSAEFSGNVPLDGSRIVHPGATTDFTIVCENSRGSATDVERVFVRTPAAVLPRVTIDANPSVIDRGESSVLVWRSTNADTCTASNGWSGNVLLNGSRTVNPTATAGFTITCSNEHGSDTDTAVVRVRTPSEPPAPPAEPTPRGDVNVNVNVNVDNSSNNSSTNTNTNDNSSNNSSTNTSSSDNTIDNRSESNNDNRNEVTARPASFDRPIVHNPTVPFFQPPFFNQPLFAPPVSSPPLVVPPTVVPVPAFRAPVVRTFAAAPTCPCPQGQGIVINNTNTLSLYCADGVCRPINGNGAGFSIGEEDTGRDENNGGFFASAGGSGITKVIGGIFLFLVGILLLGLLVYLIMEIVRAIGRRSQAPSAA